MRFDTEHRFGGSLAEVAELLMDPQFYIHLDLPDLSSPEVLELTAAGPRLTLSLRYEYVGGLDPVARRLLGSHRLSWVQRQTVDRLTGIGELSFHAQADPRRLFGTAEFKLEARGDQCVRALAGELTVAVPVIGPRAEGRIVPGVLRRLDIEAEAANRVLAERRGSPLG